MFPSHLLFTVTNPSLYLQEAQEKIHSTCRGGYLESLYVPIPVSYQKCPMVPRILPGAGQPVWVSAETLTSPRVSDVLDAVVHTDVQLLTPSFGRIEDCSTCTQLSSAYM